MIVFNISSSSKKLSYRSWEVQKCLTVIYLEDSLTICSFRKTIRICYYLHHGTSLIEFFDHVYSTCYKCVSAREHPKFSHKCLVIHKNCPATTVLLLGIYCLKNHYCGMKRMVLDKNITLFLSHKSAQHLLVLLELVGHFKISFSGWRDCLVKSN